MYGFVKAMVHVGQLKTGDFHFTDCLFFGSLMSATDPGNDLKCIMIVILAARTHPTQSEESNAINMQTLLHLVLKKCRAVPGQGELG